MPAQDQIPACWQRQVFCGGSINGSSSCTGSGAGCGCFLAVRPPIRQPLASDALDRKRGAGRIVVAELDPMVVAEIEFVEIPAQMSLADMMIGAVDAAL